MTHPTDSHATKVATYNMSISDEGYTAPWPCLVENPQPPDLQKTRELAKVVIEQYTNREQGLKKWRQMPAFVIDWTDDKKIQRKSAPIRFDWLVNHLIEHRKIQHEQLGLCKPDRARDNWMDADVTTWGHYAPTSNNGAPNTLTFNLRLALGPKFPVTPAIDREGFATTSPQLHLQRGLLLARARILNEAQLLVPQKFDRDKGEHAQFIMGGNPPLAALMEFFNLWVSIVDISLMQAYYAGYYASNETGLVFRETLMGPATGRRVSDKIKWIRALSGVELNAREEIKTFKALKDVRNHLAHFDPPCFAVTIDDIAGWLSKVPDLAWLLIKIRQCLKLPISGYIIQMALCPLVLAVPRDPRHERHVQRDEVGYRSSTWKGPHPHRGRDDLQVPEPLIDKIEQLRARTKKLIGREIALPEIIRCVLSQRLSQLEGMSNDGVMKQLGEVLQASKT